MAVGNGTNITVLVTTDGGTTFAAIGSETNAVFSQTTEYIDVSTKESRKRAGLPGKYSASVTVDNMYVEGSANVALLETASRNGTTIAIQRAVAGEGTEGNRYRDGFHRNPRIRGCVNYIDDA
jgi:hypothetical protein